MIKAYIFDWIGTLGTVSSIDGVKKIIGKELHDSLMTHMFNDVYMKEKELVYKLLMEEEHRLYDDSEQVIKKLKGEGYKLAIISNMYELSAKKIRESFPNIISCMDVVIFSSEVGFEKPNLEIFLHTLDKLKLKSRETMMIGDKYKKDIAPALNLKMNARLIERDKGQTLLDVI